MSFITSIINKLDDYFSANENKIISKLKYDLSDKEDIIKYADKTINTLQKELISTNNELLATELLIIKLKQETITPFNKMLKVKKTRYMWKPGKKIYLHLSLEDFSNDIEYQELYLSFIKELGLKDSYKNIDEAVYKIVLMVQKYINKTLKDDYQTDKEVFGVSEYWLSPREAFNQYVINLISSDCEDVSALLYGSIVSGLNYLGYDYSNRLLRVDINFPVGHAVVSYQKSNGVWVCIESTYGESRFSKNWVRDKDMFKGVYTGLWHIFDERTEYELIHPYQRK